MERDLGSDDGSVKSESFRVVDFLAPGLRSLEKVLGRELWLERIMTHDQLDKYGDNISFETHISIEMPVYACYWVGGKEVKRALVWNEQEGRTGEYKSKFYNRVRVLGGLPPVVTQVPNTGV